MNNGQSYGFNAEPQVVKTGGLKYKTNNQMRQVQMEETDDGFDNQTGGLTTHQNQRYEKLESESNTNPSVYQANYYYIDKAPTPHYVPFAPGLEIFTQIEHYDWDLHDFDLEVEPI